MYLLFKHIHLWLSLLLLLPACVQEELQQIPNEGEGILRLGNPTVIATLSSDKDTKATASLPDGVGTPDASAFQIDIYNEAGTELVKGDVNTTDEYVLATGKYRIKVTPTTASNPALITTTAPAYFEGSTIVEVKPLQVNTASVTVYWGYSILNVSVTDDLAFHLKTCSLEVKVGTETQTYAMKSDKTFETLYLLGGREAMVTLKGTNYMNEAVSAVLLPNKELPRATSYAITANPDDIKKFDIISAVEAVHTYNSGTLTGTDVTLTIANDIPKELISNWSAELKSTDGTTVYRTYSSSNLSNAKMVVANNWPYIPKGTYTLHYAYQMNNINYSGTETLAVTEDPRFTVTLSAYTSYDKYAGTNGIAKNVTDANNCNAETLYNAGATWSISTDLMANKNYAKTLKIYIDGDASARTFEVRDEYGDNSYYENIGNLSWAAHTLKASVTFDGVTVESAEQTHHITGLPYKAVPPTDKDWDRIGGNITWKNDHVDMYYSAASYPNIKSPSFYVPNDISVKIQPDIRKNNWGLNYNLDIYMNEGSSLYKDEIKKNAQFTTELYTTMTTTKNVFYIEHEWAAGGPRIYVYKFNIYYNN